MCMIEIVRVPCLKNTRDKRSLIKIKILRWQIFYQRVKRFNRGVWQLFYRFADRSQSQVKMIKLYLLRARYVKSTRRNRNSVNNFYWNHIFQRRCRVIYYCQRKLLSIPRDTAAGRSADSLSRDRLFEKPPFVYQAMYSKFDTWHSTNWLGYRIGRSYFSCYRIARAQFTSFTVAEIGGVDLGAVARLKSRLRLLSYSPHHKCFMSGETLTSGLRVMSGSATWEDRPIQTTARIGVAHVGYEILSNTHSVRVNPGKACLRNFRFSANNVVPQNRSNYSFKFDRRTHVCASVRRMKFEYLKTIVLR